MDLKSLLMTGLMLSLLLTVFGFGLRSTLDDVLYLFRRPGLLVRSVLAIFVIMPIVVYLLARAVNAPRPVEVVMMALALSPVPPLLPKKLHKAGMQSGYTVGLMVGAALLTVVMMPAMLFFLERALEKSFVMPRAEIVRTILTFVVVPIIVGLIVKKVLPAFADRIEKPITAIATVLLALALFALVGSSLSSLWRLSEMPTLALIVGFVLAGLAIGHLMAGADPERQGVLAIATASRHPGIAIALASANAPNEPFGGPVLLYLLLSAIVAIPYLNWQKARVVAPA